MASQSVVDCIDERVTRAAFLFLMKFPASYEDDLYYDIKIVSLVGFLPVGCIQIVLVARLLYISLVAPCLGTTSRFLCSVASF